jgi:hypothetical protein
MKDVLCGMATNAPYVTASPDRDGDGEWTVIG